MCIRDSPDSSWPLLNGLDVLVVDALRWRKHSTHFNVDQAIETASRIGASRTYFTHMSHDLLHEVTCAALPPKVTLAYDGLRLSVAEETPLNVINLSAKCASPTS